MTSRSPKPNRTRPATRQPHRLDPFAVPDAAPTLQQIRRIRDAAPPVHVVLREVDRDRDRVA